MDNALDLSPPCPFDARTQLCAVIGRPVGHSLSPAMHNAAFQAAGLNYAYLAFEVENLEGCMSGMRAMKGFRGLSVTIPHKINIMHYLDEIEPLASRVGCVNTVVNNNGRLTGAITDGLGTLRAFERAGVSLENKTVLFVGTGGAARAVAFAMAATGSLSGLHIAGRTAARVEELVRDVQKCSDTPVSGGALQAMTPEKASQYEVIIHATPVGMYGHSEDSSSVPREWLRAGQVVFDMVYRPRRTRLLQDAEAAGCTTIPGLEMLLYQAALQFERWTRRPAPEDVMRQALVASLQSTARE